MSAILSDYNKNGESASVVAQPKLFADLNLSLIVNPISKDLDPVTDIDAVKNSIKNLVLTNFHDRPFNPTMGTGLFALLFENATRFTAIEIKNAIKKVISLHEKRATDVEVTVKDMSDDNRYLITISYRVFYNNNNTTFDFFLTRLR